MVGGGGKIGGGPGIPTPAPNTQAAAEGQKTTGQSPSSQVSGKPASDSFVRQAQQAGTAGGVKPQLIGEGEVSGTAEMLRLAKENPAQARRLVATMASQSTNAMTDLDKTLAAARTLLGQMASEKYSKKKRQEKGRELRKLRDKLKALKRRLNVGSRKMSLLQQLAGKLGDPRLDEELERLLSNHSKLQTDWGRRHHLISMADTLYGEVDEETPEHLRDVVRASMRGTPGHAEANAMHQVSPRRVIAEMIARGLDGSTGTPEEVEPTPEAFGTSGRTLQSYTALKTVFDEALMRDPLDTDDDSEPA